MNGALMVAGGPLSLKQLRHEIECSPAQIIAVDGGGLMLDRLGKTPHVLIGDFDSLPIELVNRFTMEGVEVHRYPAEKDQTDLELALDWTFEHQLREVRILGGLGRRLDHTLGNIGLLVRALRQGITAWLVDEMHEMCVIDRQIVLQAKDGWALSLIPLPTAIGVTTEGLEYPLRQENLYFDYSRGLHNRFVANEVRVKLDEGKLLVIRFKED